MADDPTAARTPRWTKRIVTELSGRDPLGLSRVSGMLIDYLVKGITSTTVRARYYSFYPWSLWNIEISEKPVRTLEFRTAFRRREAFVALSTLHSSPDSASVVGADAVRPRLAKYIETNEVETSFALLPSNPMGGYGQYYGGSLYALGLTRRTEDGIDRVAIGRGEALAKAFEHSVAGTPYFKKKYFLETSLPMEVLKKSAEQFSLDSLHAEPAAEERELLQDLFFSLDRSDFGEKDLLRRHTLGLILYTVSEYGKAGFNPPNSDRYLVYPTYYHDVLWLGEKPPIPYQPPAPLATCYGFWRQFCAHEYLTQALEYLMVGTLEILNLETSGVTGMTLDKLCSHLTDRNFEATLEKLFGVVLKPQDLMAALSLDTVPSEEQCRAAQANIGLSKSTSEWALLDHGNAPGEIVAAAVGLLAILYSKWRGSRNEFAVYIGTQTGSDLWIGNILPALDQWFQPNLSWKTALTFLIENFVLDQHDKIMYEKGRLESCWLHRAEGKIYKDQDYQPFLRGSRHWNCVNVLTDIGLLECGSNDQISITDQGRVQLSRILKPDVAHK